MTISISQKFIIVGALALLLAAPAFTTHAAEPSVTTLQSQYQMLMERFESLKKERFGNGSTTASSTRPEKEHSSSTRPVKNASTTVDRTCMATAVATREASIKATWTTFTGSIASALETRTTALVAAWNGSADGSREAIKKAWADWKNSSKAAHTKLRSDRRAAWDTFKKTAKDSCKVTTPKEEGLDKEAKDSLVL